MSSPSPPVLVAARQRKLWPGSNFALLGRKQLPACLMTVTLVAGRVGESEGPEHSAPVEAGMPGQPGQHGKNCARQHRERCEREGLRPWQVAQAIHRCCSVTLLKAHRLAREWTLDHVAEQGRNICVEQGLGQPSLSAQRLSHWESGREAPSPKYLDLLCQIYRTRPDRLGFGHDYSDEEAGTPAATSTEIALPTRPESDVAPLRSAEPTPWVGGGGKRPDSGEEAEEEMRRRAMLQGILLGAGVSL